MNEHLVREITNRVHVANEARLTQPFPAPAVPVRLIVVRVHRDWSGRWLPWSSDYTAEIHDLVHACAARSGARIERIAFAWNRTALSHRALMTADDIELTRAEPGQPPHEMRLTAANGVRFILRVVAPAR